ncbi:MAG: bifunctional alpha,alpha-trehalose-phosphate synthase (UDP-forming)/trehalose-phosphatase [Pseudomonadota bacterium]
MKSTGSLIVVSNRLPVQIHHEGGSWKAQPSSGGLVSALAGVKSELEFRWIGWPGTIVPKVEEGEVCSLLETGLGYLPVFLEANQVDHFYDGFCNSVLWPLFHYLPGRVDFGLPYWDEYQRVNETFAKVVLDSCGEQSTVWIHDYHLMLLPALLRAKHPGLKIGFFLHIPFPASEIYRLLPVRREILLGLMGSDLIGFHTHDYARYFANSCLRILGAESQPTQIRYEGRQIRYGSYPIGINAAPFHQMLQGGDIEPNRQALAQKYTDIKIVLGVDRIDYSKGLPLKLRAFEVFLETHPEWRGKVVLIQVGIPSRLAVKEYQQLKGEVDQLVGRINGRFGDAQHSPIQYVAHEIGFPELCALYERADVLLVTSVRDGMNLVALEYAACQKDRHGVLVLSEFAGAASSMGGSLFVNPWDAVQTANAISRALTMETNERASRAVHNFTYVRNFHSLGWARRFLRDLTSEKGRPEGAAIDLMTDFIRLRRQWQRAPQRFLFLDYDGTLVPFLRRPSEARPPEHLLNILSTLASEPKNHLYLISGRKTEEMDLWFSSFHANLAAEHGLFLKLSGSAEWRKHREVKADWIPTVEKILEDYTRRVPGSSIERKQLGLAWHYREADEQFGDWQALELSLYLDGALSNLPVRVVQGHKVIEVRPQGIDKGSLVSDILGRQAQAPEFILCVGDDRTDEDMFAVLPPEAWGCRVGNPVDSCARYYLENPQEVTELLEELAFIS